MFLCLMAPFHKAANAQTNDQLTQIILTQDSLFWNTYNTCDVNGMERFFTPEVEFYHDKGGPSKGRDQLLEVSRKNLCGNAAFRLRREAVPGTLQVYPMHHNNAVYGAILSGEHVFSIVENGQPPRLDGQARFTHLWLLQDGVWRMSRILSYDHGPARYNPVK